MLPAACEHARAQAPKDALLDLDAAVVRGENLAFVFFQFRRREPFRIHQRLLALVVGGGHGEVRLGDLDVVAEDRVIADLERADAGALPLALFDGRNRLPAGRGDARADRRAPRSTPAAIAPPSAMRQRRLRHQRRIDARGHVVERVEAC